MLSGLASRVRKILAVVLQWLGSIFRTVQQPAVLLLFDVTINGVQRQGVTDMIMTATQQVGLLIRPVDAKGNAAPIEPSPVWASSNPAVATVAVDGELKAVVYAVGIGTAQITCAAKAIDLNKDGVAADLLGVLDIEIVGGEAVGMQIIAGTPQEQIVL